MHHWSDHNRHHRPSGAWRDEASFAAQETIAAGSRGEMARRVKPSHGTASVLWPTTSDSTRRIPEHRELWRRNLAGTRSGATVVLSRPDEACGSGKTLPRNPPKTTAQE